MTVYDVLHRHLIGMMAGTVDPNMNKQPDTHAQEKRIFSEKNAPAGTLTAQKRIF